MEKEGFEVILENLRNDFKIFGEAQADVRERVIGIENTLEKMSDDLEIIKSALKRKVDIEEFEALARRVLVVEKRLAKQNI